MARDPDSATPPIDADSRAGAEVVGLVPAGPDGVPVPIFTDPGGPPDDGAPPAAGGVASDAPPPGGAGSRARGLDAPFAPGGEDDAPEVRRRRERRDVRLLVGMVLALVGIPTVMTIVALVAELISRRSGG